MTYTWIQLTHIHTIQVKVTAWACKLIQCQQDKLHIYWGRFYFRAIHCKTKVSYTYPQATLRNRSFEFQTLSVIKTDYTLPEASFIKQKVKTMDTNVNVSLGCLLPVQAQRAPRLGWDREGKHRLCLLLYIGTSLRLTGEWFPDTFGAWKIYSLLKCNALIWRILHLQTAYCPLLLFFYERSLIKYLET